ncbi:Bax inhibitor-1/YccA family protein [Labrys monachus]|uniref:FtsH-binding integral membrane protein n=1 Tax=Labrys monachus TaxID=217067 RepID=A0ABU0FNY2_9HYPH|nr:Bax inhibitor-1/YccA family protein [Labrys monachus]MDQ0396319.1 FtsH-binding integral membrane protein [Labrys monachus]
MASNDPRFSIGSYTDARAGAPAIDQGLRAFMLAVYNHMTIGVALTGLVALGTYMASAIEVNGQLTGLTAFGQVLYLSPLKYVVMLAPLGLVMWLGMGAEKMSASTARALFYVYAALMGLSLSTIFLVYAHGSIARVFFISAASFGALSLYGYTTKRNLSAMGSFLMMGLIGLLIASVVNMFFPSGPLTFLISVVGVGVFAGLTAWDTQKIKSMYLQGGRTQEEGYKLAILGALELYLDFINLFLMMLRLLGDRR